MTTTFDLGSGITANAPATKRIADQNYANGFEYQWLLEYIRNYEQALERQKKRTGKERFVQDFVNVDVNGSDIVKIRMWNTAVPMTYDEMAAYLLFFGDGADDRWSLDRADGSYGQGATSSTMPWNRNGIVAISVDPTTKEAIGMIRVETDEIIAPALLEHPTEVDPIDGAPERASIVPIVKDARYTRSGLDLYSMIPDEVLQSGGMVFTLLGNHVDQHHYLGDGFRGEKMRTAVDEIEKRLYDPRNVTVSYLAEVNASEKKTGRKSGGGQRYVIDKAVYKVDNRTLKGYVEWAKRPTVKHLGKAYLDTHGTYVEVYLLARDWNWKQISKAEFSRKTREKAQWDSLSPGERRKQGLTQPYSVFEDGGKFYRKVQPDQWYPNDGKGFLRYLYKGEAMDGIPTQNLTQQMSDYGIPYTEVAERVGLLVVPPRASDVLTGAWGVQQNNSRSALHAGGKPLDYVAWGSAFQEQLHLFPDIEAAIDEARRKLMEAMPDRSGASERLLSRIKSRLLHKTMVITPQGAVDMDPTGETVPAPGVNTVPGPPKPPPKNPGPPRPTAQGQPPIDPSNPQAKGNIRKTTTLPEVVWLPKLDGVTTWESMGLPPQGDGEQFAYIARDSTSMIIFLNREHNVYREQVAYYTGEWLAKRPKMRSLSHEVVKKVEDAYDELARSVVLHIHAECKNISLVINMLSPKDWDDRYPGMPNPLSSALHGFINADLVITQSMSSEKLGMGRTAAA